MDVFVLAKAGTVAAKPVALIPPARSRVARVDSTADIAPMRMTEWTAISARGDVMARMAMEMRHRLPARPVGTALGREIDQGLGRPVLEARLFVRVQIPLELTVRTLGRGLLLPPRGTPQTQLTHLRTEAPTAPVKLLRSNLFIRKQHHESAIRAARAMRFRNSPLNGKAVQSFQLIEK